MTVVGSGLGSSIGIAKEASYGYYAVPTSWTEFTDESLEFSPHFYQGKGLAAGNTTPKAAQRVVTAAEALGSVKTMMFQNGMGKWLSNFTGDTSAPVQQGGGAAYLQTHAWAANPAGVSHTIQKGVAQTNGTVNPYTLVGGKITDATFSCSDGNPLEVQWTLDGQDLLTTNNPTQPVATTLTTGTNSSGASTLTVSSTTNFASAGSIVVGGTTYTYSGTSGGTSFTGVSPTLAATYSAGTGVFPLPTFTSPTYLTSNPEYHFAEMTVKAGTYGSETAVAGVRKFQAQIKRPYDTKRFFADGTGRKSEPIQNDFTDFKITLDTDYIDTTVFADKFPGQTNISLIFTWTSTIIASTYAYSYTMAFPNCRLDKETPKVGGPGVVTPSFQFTTLNDETHTPLTVTYQSTDTAL